MTDCAHCPLKGIKGGQKCYECWLPVTIARLSGDRTIISSNIQWFVCEYQRVWYFWEHSSSLYLWEAKLGKTLHLSPSCLTMWQTKTSYSIPYGPSEKTGFCCTVNPVLSGHSKKAKTKILMTNGSLLQVQSIAECSKGSILQYPWPALSNNRFWKTIFGLFESGRFTQVLLYVKIKSANQPEHQQSDKNFCYWFPWMCECWTFKIPSSII